MNERESAMKEGLKIWSKTEEGLSVIEIQHRYSEMTALWKKSFEELEKSKEELYGKIKDELLPFLRDLSSNEASYRFFKSVYEDSRSRLSSAKAVFDYVFGGYGAIGLSVPDAHLLFTYLGLVESLGNSVLDIVVMLLVANGRDFHIECMHPPTPRIRHVVSLKDLEIEKVSLATKINFLRGNGVTEIASLVDTDLRNRVAHLRFSIEKNRVYIKGKSATSVIIDAIAVMLASLSYVDGLISGYMSSAAKEKDMPSQKMNRL